MCFGSKSKRLGRYDHPLKFLETEDIADLMNNNLDGRCDTGILDED